MSPDYFGLNYFIGEIYLLQQQPAAALEAMLDEVEEGWRLIGLAMAYHAAGEAAQSDEALASLVEKFGRDVAMNIAYIHAWRGEADAAFEWLGTARDVQDPGLSEIVTQPFFDSIRDDERWLPMLESIGRAPEQLAGIEFSIELPVNGE